MGKDIPNHSFLFYDFSINLILDLHIFSSTLSAFFCQNHFRYITNNIKMTVSLSFYAKISKR